ncbi:MAG: HNH endonuclease [Hyphomicrobiales bacterium]
MPGGYLWAPKLDKTGRHRLAYDLMVELQPGDCVFSYFQGAIRAVGVVMSEARSCARPDFGLANQFWDSDGWLVDVEFEVLEDAFDPKAMLDAYLLHGPSSHGPINSVGRANMEYLYALPLALGFVYLGEMSLDLNEVRAEGISERSLELKEDLVDEEDRRIRNRRDLGPTEIRALTLARRGQGFFRKEVAYIERGCRLTGVTERRHLRASHIKPWRESNDTERLDGSNGLLLSPHVDHLFNDGYLSFRRDGRVLRSPQLHEEVVGQWTLDLNMNVGTFTRRQENFLEYHRDVLFKFREN